MFYGKWGRTICARVGDESKIERVTFLIKASEYTNIVQKYFPCNNLSNFIHTAIFILMNNRRKIVSRFWLARKLPNFFMRSILSSNIIWCEVIFETRVGVLPPISKDRKTCLRTRQSRTEDHVRDWNWRPKSPRNPLFLASLFDWQSTFQLLQSWSVP